MLYVLLCLLYLPPLVPLGLVRTRAGGAVHGVAPYAARNEHGAVWFLRLRHCDGICAGRGHLSYLRVDRLEQGCWVRVGGHGRIRCQRAVLPERKRHVVDVIETIEAITTRLVRVRACGLATGLRRPAHLRSSCVVQSCAPVPAAAAAPMRPVRTGLLLSSE